MASDHGNSRLKVANSPEIEKLPNGRYRIAITCRLSDRDKDWYWENRENFWKDFGTLYDAPLGVDGVNTGWTPDTGETYADMRLVAQRTRHDEGREEMFVTFVYETLTSAWVKEDDDKPSSTENGLRVIERAEVAAPGTALPYAETDVGSKTISDGGKTLFLAGFTDESGDRKGRITSRWVEAGILSVATPKVGGQQRVVISAIGMTEAEVTSALSEVTDNHKLVDVSESDYEGFRTREFTFEVDDFMAIIAADNDLTAIRRTRLSATEISRGTINDTAITVDSKTFVLRQEELDNDGVIKKAEGVYVAYEANSFPPTTLFEIDRRYGFAIPIERQVVASSESGVIDDTKSVQVEPIDSFRSVKFTALASDVPAQQVWYERRFVNSFPSVLDYVSVVGSETYALFPNYIEPPDTPLKVRVTRKFTWGPPPETTGANARVFYPRSFSAGVEVDVTSESQTISESEGSSTSETTSDNSGTSTSETTSSNTGSSNSQTTSSNTGSSTNSTSSSNSGSSASEVTSSNTSDSTSETTSENSGSSTSETTSENSGSSSSETNRSSSVDSSSSSTNGSESEHRSAVGRSVFISDTERNTVSNSNTNSDGFSTSESSGTANSTNTSSNSGSSSSNTTSSNTGTSTNNTSSENTSSSTSENTSNNESSSTSENSSDNTSSSTSETASDNTGSSTSRTTNSNSGTSTSDTTNSSLTNSQSTGKRIISLNVRPCLRAATKVVVQGIEINIPATSPENLPWGEYTEISRQASHWKHNVWVEEVAEALLPSAP